jgi:cytoskeleton protein RodZ
MNAAPIVDAHHQDQILEGPGSRLRQTRLSKGLEMSRVAAQLHLSDALIEALEKDDYDSLPGPVFIRGYLRNYTRLLGMDPQSVLDEYERLAPADGGGSPLTQKSNIGNDVESSHLLVRMVTWVMVILLIALLVVWWQGRLSWPLNDEDPAQTRADATSPMDTAKGAPDAAPAPPIVEEVQMTEAPGLESGPVVPPESGAPRQTPGPMVDPAPREPPAIGAAVADGSSHGRLASGTESAVDSMSEAVPSDEPQIEARWASIEFSFSDSSWLDVRDASGENKFTGVMAQDTRRKLSGEPPFSVVLGNARVVEVWVNGEPYDVTRYIRGDVARFEVDPDSP